MVHQFAQNGHFIVMDIGSGAIHAVDKLVYDLVPCYQEYKGETLYRMLPEHEPKDIDEALREIDSLVEAGLLFAPDISPVTMEAVKNRRPVLKALCLHVAHDCNLKCAYCFAGEGEYRGRRSLMSAEVGKRALDYLLEQSGSRRNLEVDFFGGEPLMNFEVVKEIVAYGRELEGKHDKKFRFTLTTNGVLLNDGVLEFVNKEMANVVLSLDGRKEVNDRMRKKAGGQGSYDDIVPKLQKLADARGQRNYYVRGTFTAANKDFAGDVLHMAELGFKQLSVEPVVAPEDAPYALKMADVPGLFAEYEKLANKILERKAADKGFNFFHFMIDLSGGPCVIKRMTGCGAGSEYAAVTPEGGLYPCHQFAGLADFYMGDIFEGVTRPEVGRRFEGCNVYTKSHCADCFAKYYCSGGCAANGYFAGGDINAQYKLGCELARKRTECAVMIKVDEAKYAKNIENID